MPRRLRKDRIGLTFNFKILQGRYWQGSSNYRQSATWHAQGVKQTVQRTHINTRLPRRQGDERQSFSTNQFIASQEGFTFKLALKKKARRKINTTVKRATVELQLRG